MTTSEVAYYLGLVSMMDADKERRTPVIDVDMSEEVIPPGMGQYVRRQKMLKQLQEAMQERHRAAAAVTELVVQAKRAGATWDDIGVALDMTRQAAHSTYAKATRSG